MWFFPWQFCSTSQTAVNNSWKSMSMCVQVIYGGQTCSLCMFHSQISAPLSTEYNKDRNIKLQKQPQSLQNCLTLWKVKTLQVFKKYVFSFKSSVNLVIVKNKSSHTFCKLPCWTNRSSFPSFHYTPTFEKTFIVWFLQRHLGHYYKKLSLLPKQAGCPPSAELLKFIWFMKIPSVVQYLSTAKWKKDKLTLESWV